VKSITALIKKPRKPRHVIAESEWKSSPVNIKEKIYLVIFV
jgi:hypothetical protein